MVTFGSNVRASVQYNSFLEMSSHFSFAPHFQGLNYFFLAGCICRSDLTRPQCVTEVHACDIGAEDSLEALG